MRRRVCVCLLVTACGRENFDDAGGRDTAGSGSGTISGDQDGDSIDSTVDNCPHMFNQSQLDADGDGVGEACDPRPAVAGDKLFAIGLFASDFGAWVPDAITNWTLSDGFLSTAANPPADSTARLSLTTSAQSPTLQVSFIVRDYGTTNTEIVRLRLAQLANSWDCEHISYGGQLSQLNLLPLAGTSGAVANGSILPVISTGSVNVTWFSRDQTTVGCAVNGMPFTTSANAGLTASVTATIEVSSLRASLSYAAVYGIVP